MSEQVSKPKGWYGQEVARLSKEFERILEEIADLNRTVDGMPELVGHPLIRDWSAFYQRQRRMEQMVDNLTSSVSQFARRIEALEGAVRSLQGRK